MLPSNHSVEETSMSPVPRSRVLFPRYSLVVTVEGDLGVIMGATKSTAIALVQQRSGIASSSPWSMESRGYVTLLTLSEQMKCS